MSQPEGQDSDSYFLDIESRFAQLRGTPFVFSAKDWNLMKEWHEEGIPVAVVLEALERAFENREASGRKRDISSLSYCRGAVRSIWKERREMQVGAEASVPELDGQARLADLTGALSRAAQRAAPPVDGLLHDAAVRVAELGQGSTPQIEKRLIEIEDSLLSAIIERMDGEMRAAIDTRVEDAVAQISFDDEETEKRTRRSARVRAIRRHLSLPRLTLF